MSSTPHHAGRWLLLQLPTVLVLAALAGVGYVGYLTDWKVPKVSALLHPQPPAAEEAAIKLVPDPESQKAADPCVRQLQKLEIQFPEAEDAARAGLQFAPVATRPMAQYVTANGTVDYDQNKIAHLSVPVSGIAWRVDKHKGDHVKKGDVLALVESAEVGKAKAEFRTYLAEVLTRQYRLNLLQPRTVSEVTLIEAKNALKTALIQLTNAQQTLINLGLPVKIEDVDKLSEQELAERMRTLGLPDSVVRTLDAKSMSDNLIPLKAPFDGEVVGRDIVKGELVGPTKPIQFTVADLSTLCVLLDVREEDRDKVQLDQEATFQPDGTHAEPVAGKVKWLSRELEEKTRTMRVRVDVDSPGGRLLVHSFGTGRILVRSVPNAVAVPEDAVQTRDRCNFVFVRLDDRRFQTRLVKVGLRSEEFVQVLDGLAPGEEVVTVGSHALKAEALRHLIAGDD